MILAIKTVRCNSLGANKIGIYLQLLLAKNYFLEKKRCSRVGKSHNICPILYFLPKSRSSGGNLNNVQNSPDIP